MRLTIDFDGYETALIRKARKDLLSVAKKKGKPAPSMKDVARGAVRMGIHAIYGEEYVSQDLLDQTVHDDLVP